MNIQNFLAMFKTLTYKKIALILIGGIILLSLLSAIISPQKPGVPSPFSFFHPSPTPPPVYLRHTFFKPLSLTSLPKLPDDQGGGVDTDADTIQTAIAQNQILYKHLPYTTDITLSTGLTVQIVIPGEDLQTNGWTLLVQVFGINFESSPGDGDYNYMKQSFRNAADIIFSWIKNNGADPDKLYIDWGGKKYIQDKAKQWLEEH